ncbi:hypothetical protein SUGI_0573200 [Cryptomeria japonica]|nr:hypothetical protein SUGI_0573200 [Cryptomeria japonica]
MLYTYDNLLHDFVARLTKAEAKAMEVMHNFLAIIPSSLNKIPPPTHQSFLVSPPPLDCGRATLHMASIS